ISIISVQEILRVQPLLPCFTNGAAIYDGARSIRRTINAVGAGTQPGDVLMVFDLQSTPQGQFLISSPLSVTCNVDRALPVTDNRRRGLNRRLSPVHTNSLLRNHGSHFRDIAIIGLLCHQSLVSFLFGQLRCPICQLSGGTDDKCMVIRKRILTWLKSFLCFPPYSLRHVLLNGGGKLFPYLVFHKDVLGVYIGSTIRSSGTAAYSRRIIAGHIRNDKIEKCNI